MILAIETATPVCSVAIGTEHELVECVSSKEDQSHSRILTDQIQSILQQAQIKKNELTAVAVSLGPGSYTGLRIGLSAAKALCYALDIPLVGISTLKSMAWNMKQQIDAPDSVKLMPMIDARRMEVYMATYDSKLNEIEKPQARILNDQSFDPYNKDSNSTYIFGTGAEKTKHFDLASHVMIYEPFNISAASLIPLCVERLRQSKSDSVAYTEPFYIKGHFSPNTEG